MIQLTLPYNRKSIEHEHSLDTEYKKKNGVFYTDLQLARTMVDLLHVDKNSLIIDPCCGTGNFLKAAKEFGFANVYGADIDEDAINICKEEIQTSNILTLDTIANDSTSIINSFALKRKFDVVIGNPPYFPIKKSKTIFSKDIEFVTNVRASGNNLFIAALLRALDLLVDNGIMSYIIPKNFLHVSAYSKIRREILLQKTIVSIIDLGAYFNNVRGEQIIITIKNARPNNNKIHFYKYINLGQTELTTIDQSFYNDEILIFQNYKDLQIFNKFTETNWTLKDYCEGYIGRGRSRSNKAVSGKEIRKFGLKDRQMSSEGNLIFIQNIYSSESGVIGCFGGDLEAKETVTVITDGNSETARYLLAFLHSRVCNFFLYKFCYNNSKLTMHTDPEYLRKIPLPRKDSNLESLIVNIEHELENESYMSDTWFKILETLNSTIYQAYGFGPLERNYIDETLSRIQSKRWKNISDRK